MDATDGKKLMTAQQKLFCYYYISNGFKGSEAVRKAGYTGAANVRASTLLSKPVIKEYIQKELRVIKKETNVDAEELMNILSSICRGENHDDVYYTIYGKTKEIRCIPVRPKLKDRLKAIDLMCKILKLMEPPKQEVIFDMGLVPTNVLKEVKEKMEENND